MLAQIVPMSLRVLLFHELSHDLLKAVFSSPVWQDRNIGILDGPPTTLLLIQRLTSVDKVYRGLVCLYASCPDN